MGWLKQGDFGLGSGEYERYSDITQVSAFCMSFFLGMFGGGRLYVGDTSAGIVKLLLCLLVCCYPCIMTLSCGKKSGNRRVIAMKDLKSAGGIFMSIIGCVAFFALLIWIIVDIVLFGMNEIPDSDGLPLQPW